MPGPFPAPPIFQGKSPGDEVGSSRSSNEDSADKSDEQDIQELAEEENPRVSGGCSRVGKGRRRLGC